jgi:PleD family two-component response regulator
MAEPYVVNGIPLQAGATPESLLAAADDAMYRTKAERKAAALSGSA